METFVYVSLLYEWWCSTWVLLDLEVKKYLRLLMDHEKVEASSVCPCLNNATLDTVINFKFAVYFTARFYLLA